MAQTGYHAQYQQQRPPRQAYNAPQQYPDRSYNRQQQQQIPYSPAGGNPYANESSQSAHRGHNQRAYNGYDERGQYAQDGHWDQGHYAEHYENQYQDYRSQDVNGHEHYGQPQQLPQPRTYHYDERYHANERHQVQPNSSSRRGETRKDNAAGAPQQKPKERILTNRPPSPKAVPWDNPFGAFPGMRKGQDQKESESKTRGNQDKQRAGAVTPSGRSTRTDSRPATSQEHRPRHETQRPHTSQSYNQPDNEYTGNNLSPLDDPRHESSQAPDRGERSLGAPGAFNARMQSGAIGLPSRPAPQRAATGPVQSQASLYQRKDLPVEQSYPSSAHPAVQRNPVDLVQARPGRSSIERGNYGGNSSRGTPLNKPNFNESDLDMPNFAAMGPGTTEAVEGAVTMQQPAYQKQTYQAAIPSTPSQQHPNAQYISYNATHSSSTPSFHHPYNQPSAVPYQSPQNQAYSPSGPEANRSYREEQQQGFDFNNPNYGQHFAFDQGFKPPTQDSRGYEEPSYSPDVRRQGYDPRLQLEGVSTPVSARDVYNEPNRPNMLSRTTTAGSLGGPQSPSMAPNANLSHPGPVRYFNERTSSSTYRSNASFPDSDASHPVPVRPGLMSPPPPQPQANAATMQQIPLPKSNPPAANQTQPIMIGEVNNMRENYRAHPENHELGLRFAKRLVEAAKVLASEGGRADPKQTQRNRERYIFDAHKIIKKLIAAGYPEAMFYLADCYGSGQLGLQPDPREAYNLYQSAAKLGHAQSAYRVAVCCELGSQEGGGTKRDHMKAVQYYKRAASLGDAPAMYKMGMILLKGLLGHQANPREAISWLKRAAERADKENPHALHELGLLYASAGPRDIVVRDEEYAYQLFKQAADLGYKHSQFRLGSAFEYGLLKRPIDPRSSIAWYTKAAAQGEHQAEFALSGWYLTGSPPLLEQSDSEAYLWAKKAAMAGLAKAEYAMGYYTEVGIGTNSDMNESLIWYRRAAGQEHPKARERLDDLKRGGGRMQKRRVSRSNVGKQNEGECTVM